MRLFTTREIFIVIEMTIARGVVAPCSSASSGRSPWFSLSALLGVGFGLLLLCCALLAPGAAHAAIVDVGSGAYGSCSLSTGGEVYCWGGSQTLGSAASGGNSLVPRYVALGERAVDVDLHYQTACAALAGGTVKCWGENVSGQVGDGTQVQRQSPVSVSGITQAVHVDVGDGFACAVLLNGTARCWGSGAAGQLGDGNGVSSNSPVEVTGVTDALKISAGGGSACVTRPGGGVKCWGTGPLGQVGGASSSSLVPVDVSGVTDVVEVVVGQDHACARTSAGELHCWGNNGHGQFGNGTSTGSGPSLRITLGYAIDAVAAGLGATCVIDASGRPLCSGLNQNRVLATAEVASSQTFLTIAASQPATVIAIGHYMTACSGSDSAGLECWGRGTSGGIGNGVDYSATTYQVSPSAVRLSPDGPTSVTATVSGVSALSVGFVPGDANGAAISSFTATCTSSGGGVTSSASGTVSPIIVGSLTAGAAYACTVRASSSLADSVESASASRTAVSAPAAPVITGVSRSVPNQFSVAFTPGSANGGTVSAYTATCVSSNGGTTQTGSGTTSPVVVSALTTAKTYMCSVVATNELGDSPASSPSSSLDAADVPAAPTIGVVSVSGAGQLSVAFTPGASNGAPISSYAASCTSTDGGASRSSSGSSGPVVVSGLSVTKSYTCSVTATNVVGTSVSSASSASVVAADVPSAPTSVTASASAANALSVAFSPPGSSGGAVVTGYEATCSASGGVTQRASGSASPLIVVGLTGGKAYSCRVSATNGGGVSAPSEPSSAVTVTGDANAPSVATSLSAGGSVYAGAASCAVVTGGDVYCWGDWQLTGGGSGNRPTPTRIDMGGVATSVSVSSHQSNACATLATGSVKCWGGNWRGEFGNGTSGSGASSYSPVSVSSISTASAVSVGAQSVCALLADATVRCWGDNQFGQLGNGATSSSPVTSPVQVVGIANAVQVDSGGSRTCAVLTTGAVKCWGLLPNADGTSRTASTPEVVAGITGAAEVAVGQAICARLADGHLKCWGQYVGDGTDAQSATPVDVPDIADAMDVDAGAQHVCVARALGGRVVCWGADTSGATGNGRTTSALSPVEVTGLTGVTQVAAGNGNSCAVAVGRVRCWGANKQGQLGNGMAWVGYAGSPVTPAAISNASDIFAGGSNTCARLSTGEFKCWGYNLLGEVGDGTTTTRFLPTSVAGVDGATQIASGSGHSCALMLDRRVKCWGQNIYGELGDGLPVGTGSSALVPQYVVGLSDVVEIGAAGTLTCARITDGRVKCWGAGWSGQLGNGSTSDSSTPVLVSGVTSATNIAVASGFACARISSGSVVCWGSNWNSQLGDGSQTNRTTPVSVSSISNAVSVRAGNSHACAQLSTGALKCWGQNWSYQLGDGTNTSKSTPVNVTVIGSDAVDYRLSVSTTCALFATGAVKCWGGDSNGARGDGDANGWNVATNVDGVSDAVQLVSGESHFCVRRSTGAMKCWGDSQYGQLGDGQKWYSDSTVATKWLPGVPSTPTLAVAGVGRLDVSFTAGANAGPTPVTYTTTCTSSNGGTTRNASASASPITVTGLTVGSSYSCAVVASNSDGDAAATAASTSTSVPAAPSATSAPTMTATGPTSLSASFSPDADGGSAITGYTVTCTSSDGGATATGSGTASPVAISGLTTAATYTCSVVATNAAASSPASPASAAIIVRTAPSPPTDISVAVSGQSAFSVSFSAGAANGATISSFTATCVSSNGGTTRSATGSSSPVTVVSLTPAKSYACTVVGTSVVGSSSASAASSAITAVSVPAAPVLGTISRAVPNQFSVAFTPGSANGGTVSAYSATCISSNGGTTRSASGASSPVVVSGLTTAKTYSCSVVATNELGDSVASSPSSALDAADVPGSGVVGAVSVTGVGQVAVAFTAGASNGAAPTSHAMTCSSSDGGTTRSASGASSPITITGLTVGKTYTCVFTSTNVAGTSPASSPSSSFVPVTVPDAPSAVVASVSGSTGLAVSFVAGAANGAAISAFTATCVSSNGGTTRTGSGIASPITVSGLTAAKSYTCTVAATNAAGTSTSSAPSPAVTVVAIPGAPTIGTVTRAVPNQFSVAFAPGSANGGTVSAYTVTCVSSNGGVVRSGSGASSPVVVAGLTPAKTYSCSVVATNEVGDSVSSSPSAAVDAADVPGVGAVGVVSVTGVGQVAVAFAPGASNGAAPTSHAMTCSSSDGGTTRSASGASSPITITGLTVGKTYTCAFTSTNVVGTSGSSPASAGFVAAGLPAAPSLTSTTASIARRAVVAFGLNDANGSPVTGVTATCTSSDGGTTRAVAGAASPLTITGLTGGKTYACSVTATNAAGTSTASSVSSAITAAGVAQKVVAGKSHTCALRATGTVMCWGSDTYGQLGYGSIAADGSRLSPVAVNGLTDVIDIAVGNSHTCALLSGGTVKCWGFNVSGQLGNGTNVNSAEPVLVDDLSGVVQIDAGADHTCAIKSDTSVKCWGSNGYGQLGDGTTTATSPVPVGVYGLSTATQVSAGDFHTCARLSGGSLRCWGNNGNGQLGNNSLSPSTIPVQPSSITTAVMVAAGGSHTCAVLASGGVQCWGYNNYGQLGNSSYTQSRVPVTTSSITTATSVAAGTSHSCAVLADETQRCWGRNDSNQLGDGTTSTRISPVTVSGTAVLQQSLGEIHSCAITAAEVISCWGQGSDGRLGLVATTSAATPTTVGGWDWSAPAAPVGLVLTAPSAGSIRLDFSPGDNGSSTYVSYAATCGGSTQTSASSPITFYGLAANSTYSCTVTQRNSVARSAASAASNAVVVFGTPNAPSTPTVTQSRGNTATVAFVPGAENGATATYTASCWGSGVPDRTAMGASSPLTVTGLVSGVVYRCYVQAQNAAGYGGSSSYSTPFLSSRELIVSSVTGSGVVSDATGVISCNPACRGGVIADQMTTLTATPASGWVFAGWGGTCSGTSATCSLLMDGDKSVTAAFVQASAAPPGGSPSPTINIANNVTVNVTVTTPVNVQWSPPVVGQPTTASFTAAPDTTYSISATSSARAAKTVRGSCSVKSGKATCTIKIPAKGTWIVAITPKKKGKVGKPAKKTFKVK